eukprot:497762_1
MATGVGGVVGFALTSWIPIPGARVFGLAVGAGIGGAIDAANAVKYAKGKQDKLKDAKSLKEHELKAVLSEFHIADEKEIESLLENAKQIAFTDKQRIICEAIGLSTSGQYQQTVTESFAFGFQEEIGIETEFAVGLQVLASGTIKVCGKLSSKQEWSQSKTTTFTKSYTFAPQEIGKFEIGMTVNVAENLEIPFTGTVTITSRNCDMSGDQIMESLSKLKTFSCKIKQIGDKDVQVDVSGKITATFAVETVTSCRKIDVKQTKQPK